MAETTNPQAGVAQEPPSIESRLTALLDREPAAGDEGSEEEQAQPQGDSAEQSDGQADDGTPTLDDLPADEAPVAQPPGDAFEIVHDGKQVKLSREETIRLAQQGFDYTQKTQALAEQARAVNERFQRVAAIEQVAPQLQQAQAQVAALGAQLAPYQRVDWVALATNDPLEYSKVRAQYDVLAQTYQQAAGQYEQLRGAIGEQAQYLRAQSLQVEAQKLTERIPAWKDPAKKAAESNEIRDLLLEKGAAPQEIDALDSSVAVEVCWMALQYQKLVKAKAEKSKLLNTKPQLTRPGASATPGTAQADRQRETQLRLKKSGSVDDAAALLLMRMK